MAVGGGVRMRMTPTVQRFGPQGVVLLERNRCGLVGGSVSLGVVFGLESSKARVEVQSRPLSAYESGCTPQLLWQPLPPFHHDDGLNVGNCKQVFSDRAVMSWGLFTATEHCLRQAFSNGALRRYCNCLQI